MHEYGEIASKREISKFKTNDNILDYSNKKQGKSLNKKPLLGVGHSR